MIQDERITFLNNKPRANGRYVLYWMQASQRAEYNHALEYAILRANELKKPVVVYFGITDSFPEANERHYYFMLEGLREVQRELAARNILLVVRHESPEKGVLALAKDADFVVVDRGYLRIQKQWRSYAAEHLDNALIQVESDVVVPVETASPKEDFSAGTFRPKISKKLDEFLLPLSTNQPAVSSLHLQFDSFDLDDLDAAVSKLNVDRSVPRVNSFYGGTSAAMDLLTLFINKKLDRYADLRNDPTMDYLSNMSPYLHFGQISPLYVALEVQKADKAGSAAFLEEHIVRRELSMNFAFYNSQYDSFQALPAWALKTLNEHRGDLRAHRYTRELWENAETYDPYWNAAQKEMKITGKMHGYMRMYWGKKLLEWSETPELAFETALYLNNKYELDGRDPNGFTGVAWCFGKHDRAWFERAVFGKVRYMNANGLKRKFDADGYVRKIEQLEDGEN